MGNGGKSVEDNPGTDAQVVAPASTDRCPRCGAELAGAEACGRCGLARRFHDRFAQATVLPAELAAEWEAVLAAWEDAGRHAVFLERCAQAGALDLAAARYRPLAEDAVRGERARAALDRIVALAERELRRGATPRDTLRRNRRIVLAVALALALAFLIVIVRAFLAH